MEKTQNKKQHEFSRPPIVVVLGHVDHGKSSLLEAIRQDFEITSKESGGITQHIGAYVAEYQGKTITFIDTPGHEAFSAMRKRGAKIADLAVLVVAADEGIQPQTKEAIAVVKAAELPFVVAINKIDKPEANVEKIKQELAKEEVFVESFGGKVPCVEVSAKTKQGIKELLEMILLMTELENLASNPKESAQGVIIESFLDSKRGPAATLLVLNGTLHVGDIAGTNSTFGKVRIVETFRGESANEALPSFPALVIGFEKSPKVGEEFKVFANEDEARANLSAETLAPLGPEAQQETGKPTLNIVLKTDVAGSLEVAEQTLLGLPQEQVQLKIVDSGFGDITESDVRLAQGIKAYVIGFRVNIVKGAEDFAQRENIKVEKFDIIYDLIQRVRDLLEKSTEPAVPERKDVGKLKVLAVFFTEGKKQIIGGRVLDGEAQKGAKIEVLRNEVIVGRGRVVNLQKDKKDAQSVAQGNECGISYEGDVRLEQGDILQFFV